MYFEELTGTPYYANSITKTCGALYHVAPGPNTPKE
jgi:hypothetical protein